MELVGLEPTTALFIKGEKVPFELQAAQAWVLPYLHQVAQ